MPSRRSAAALLALPLSAVLAACGATGSTPPKDGGALTVITSFYPLEYLTARIAGDHAAVSSLTGPGSDPHEVELTPRVVGSLSSADLVVYARGLQPAVDEAVQAQAGDHSLDVTTHLALVDIDGQEQAHEPDHEHEHEHEHGGTDPHFWLDPDLYQQAAAAIEHQLATIDPDHASDYDANLAALTADLHALDDDYATGLSHCAHRDLVTTHEAFGYLARRYDLHEVGITGLSPDAEPSPARLAEVTREIRDHGTTTVFAEPLVSDVIARTVAQETGAQVLVLDPVEGLTSSSRGQDYTEIMRANLASLREGLDCS